MNLFANRRTRLTGELHQSDTKKSPGCQDLVGVFFVCQGCHKRRQLQRVGFSQVALTTSVFQHRLIFGSSLHFWHNHPEPCLCNDSCFLGVRVSRSLSSRNLIRLRTMSRLVPCCETTLKSEFLICISHLRWNHVVQLYKTVQQCSCLHSEMNCPLLVDSDVREPSLTVNKPDRVRMHNQTWVVWQARACWWPLPMSKLQPKTKLGKLQTSQFIRIRRLCSSNSNKAGKLFRLDVWCVSPELLCTVSFNALCK